MEKVICECTDRTCPHCQGKCTAQAKLNSLYGMQMPVCQGCYDCEIESANEGDFVDANCY